MSTRDADTGDRGPNAARRRRLEPLRDQIFAACGYAFAIAATVIELLTPHLGRVTLITGAALAIALVPVNVSLIRRFTRIRRALTAQRTRTPTGQSNSDAPVRHTPPL